MARMKERYQKEILPQLVQEFKYHTPMQAPRITKVVVNVGVGEALTNAKALDATVGDITSVTGHQPLRNPNTSNGSEPGALPVMIKMGSVRKKSDMTMPSMSGPTIARAVL